MTKFQCTIKLLSNKENALGAAITLLYRVCVSGHFQTTVNFIFTLFIGRFSFTTGHNINWNFLIPVGSFYITMNILFIIANNYKKQKGTLTKTTLGCLKEVTTIAYTIKESISETRKLYLDTKNNGALFNFNPFYTGAVSVCESIYYLLTDVFNYQKFKITIFQQFIREDESRYIKIIAYKSHENKRPQCYDKELPLFKNHENKLFIQKLFESNSPDIVCFDKREIIDDSFIKIDNQKINTKQYIGIPCQTEGDYISFVIQISSYDDKRFYNIGQMKDLGEEILVSYREILALINEQKLLYDNILASDRKVVPSSVADQDTRSKGKGKTFEPV
ncbi:MAG: hypothetical protein A2Y15_02330 [Clostridiales bacterium GWF2_36_10]|nr:MAG: hypothetical protein A2Y15_02330 [Clostridiales bacterium GWF2_36_10]HAN21265.1 hypothetical protein [Clostridiales bacterium]